MHCDWNEFSSSNLKQTVIQYNRGVQLLTYLLTYLLTSRSRVPLEKLTSSQLLKKVSTFYGTRRLITAFTSSLHQPLS